MILDMFKKKGAGLDKPSLEVLDQAEAQRAKMAMVFDEGVTSLSDLSCALNTIGSDTLLLDVYGLNAPGSFTGAWFTCYFRIREGKAGVGHYAFRSRVASVKQTRNGGIVFVVSLPAKVEQAQRRRSVRVRPQAAWFEELSLWRGERLEPAPPEEVLAGLAEFSTGALCRIENMSAGGVGLHLKHAFNVQAGFEPRLGETFTMKVRFAQEMRNQPRAMLLSGRAVRVQEDPVTRDTDLGIMFDNVGLVNQETGETLWKEIKDNVAEELMARVFDWHTALFRARAGQPD